MKFTMDKRFIIPSAFALAIILSIVMLNVSISLKKKNTT